MMFKDEYKKTQLKRLKVLSYFCRTRERKGEKKRHAFMIGKKVFFMLLFS